MPIRTVLFDLDDTLFDHRYAAEASLARQQAEHEVLARHPLPNLLAEYQRLLDEIHVRVLHGEVGPSEARALRVQRLFAFCGAEIDRLEAERHAARYRALYQESRRPVPGAVALLEALRGRVTLGIVSNNVTKEQWEKIRIIGIDHLLDLVVTSEDAGAIKPDPAIFLEALRQADCKPSEAVMVGDSWEADVLGAHRAGMRAIWFNPSGKPCPQPGIAEEIRSYEPAEARALTVLTGPC